LYREFGLDTGRAINIYDSHVSILQKPAEAKLPGYLASEDVNWVDRPENSNLQ
jgi:hypothetical protein